MTTTISPSLTLYLNDIGNHELLSKADEVKLSERIRKGNAAKEKMEAGDYRDLQQLQRLERIAKKGSHIFYNLTMKNLTKISTKYWNFITGYKK